jgi:hypothetical protein
MRQGEYNELMEVLERAVSFATYAHMPIRKVYSWNEGPAPETTGEDYIDRICRDLCTFPTMQAMLETYPELSKINICGWDGLADGDIGQYIPSNKCVKINMNAASEDKIFAMHSVTMLHEFRHGMQDVEGVMNIRFDELFRNDLMYMLAYQRVIEADATVFSIVNAYDAFLKDNYDPIISVGRTRGEATLAYMKEVDADRNAHWDGRAANEALKAYFSKKNKNILRTYDVTTCEDVADLPLHKCFDFNADPEIRQMKQRMFENYIKPLRRMPYMDKHGHMQERPHYMSGINFKPQALVRNLSPDVNYSLIKLRLRDLSMAPEPSSAP